MTDYTVILTHNRPQLLDDAVRAALPQCDQVVVVDNASDPPVEPGWPRTMVMQVPDQPPNLAALWNRALDRIAKEEAGQWNVALTCDDVLLPGGWYQAVSTALRTYGASAASAYSYQEYIPPAPYVLRELSNGIERMCPWAFMLPGEQGLRADESLRWWYCDTDLDWQARRRNGTVIIPGPVADNKLPSDWTSRRADLSQQTIIDGGTFWTKWTPIIHGR